MTEQLLLMLHRLVSSLHCTRSMLYIHAIGQLNRLRKLQVPSPDGSAVLQNSEQFKVHLLAALEDPRVKQ